MNEDALDAGSGPGRFGFVAGAWGGFVVLQVFAVFLAVNVLGSQVLLQLGVPRHAAVLGQIPGFFVTFWIGRALVRAVDPRGDVALGLESSAVPSFLRGLAWYGPIAVLVWSVILLLALFAQYAGISMPQQSSVKLFADASTAIWLRLGLVFVAVIAAPIGEEMFFRGVLHGWLRRYMSFAPAAVIGGALFGLMHWEGQLLTLLFAIPIGVLGLCLSWMREQRGGLWACIGVHAAHNAATLVVIYSSVQAP